MVDGSVVLEVEGAEKHSSLPPARRAPPQGLQQLTVSLFLSDI